MTLLTVVQTELENALEKQGVEDPGQVKVAVAKVIGWIHDVAKT